MTSLIYHKLYFKITRERLSDAKLNERSIKILSEDPCPWIKIDLSDEIFSRYLESVVESIVFSGLTVEAFINSYALSRVSKSKFQKLDRLSLREKWTEIPRIATGKIMHEDSIAIIKLTGLIKSRNDLVHYKAVGCAPNVYYSFVQKMLQNVKASQAFPLTMQAESNISTIKLLIDELKRLDPTVSETDLMFDEDENRWFELWSKL